MPKLLTPAELAAIHDRTLRGKIYPDDIVALLYTAETCREIVDALAYESRYQAETGEGSTHYLARLIDRSQSVLEGVDGDDNEASDIPEAERKPCWYYYERYLAPYAERVETVHEALHRAAADLESNAAAPYAIVSDSGWIMDRSAIDAWDNAQYERAQAEKGSHSGKTVDEIEFREFDGVLWKVI